MHAHTDTHTHRVQDAWFSVTRFCYFCVYITTWARHDDSDRLDRKKEQQQIARIDSEKFRNTFKVKACISLTGKDNRDRKTENIMGIY